MISSAGQLGRGGNVSIDGMDDNDDVVGGMLLNVPEDAVQEFQVATNRFSAELGRSGSTVVNVVTKSGTNSLHGSASVYERDQSLQALPATFNPSSTEGALPPFRRQQYAGTVGGPLVKDKAWWFAGFEYRNELGGLQVATRYPNVTGGGGTISDSYAPEPLTDPMGTLRARLEDFRQGYSHTALQYRTARRNRRHTLSCRPAHRWCLGEAGLEQPLPDISGCLDACAEPDSGQPGQL